MVVNVGNTIYMNEGIGGRVLIYSSVVASCFPLSYKTISFSNEIFVRRAFLELAPSAPSRSIAANLKIYSYMF